MDRIRTKPADTGFVQVPSGGSFWPVSADENYPLISSFIRG